MRQALAGMLWSKQFYHYDVDKWLEERGSDPFKVTRKAAPRNDHWHHMYNGDVISMPDKWEYPWYAAWDLAFHVIALSLVDPDFAKQQLKLMLESRRRSRCARISARTTRWHSLNRPGNAPLALTNRIPNIIDMTVHHILEGTCHVSRAPRAASSNNWFLDHTGPLNEYRLIPRN
jgi:hypothetical protein